MEQLELFAVKPENAVSWLKSKALKGADSMVDKTIKDIGINPRWVFLRFTDGSFIFIGRALINTLLEEELEDLSVLFSLEEMNFIRQIRDDENLLRNL